MEEVYEDTYVYVSVKLYLKHGQTDDSIQEIVQECDYSFVHSQIIDHEIVDILDTQVAGDNDVKQQQLPWAKDLQEAIDKDEFITDETLHGRAGNYFIDPFELPDVSESIEDNALTNLHAATKALLED